MDDINKLIEILKNFEQEHRDLDEILIRLQEKNTVDFLSEAKSSLANKNF